METYVRYLNGDDIGKGKLATEIRKLRGYDIDPWERVPAVAMTYLHARESLNKRQTTAVEPDAPAPPSLTKGNFTVWDADEKGEAIIPAPIPEKYWTQEQYPGNMWHRGKERIELFKSLRPQATDVKVIVPPHPGVTGKNVAKKTALKNYIQAIREYAPQYLTTHSQCEEEKTKLTPDQTFKEVQVIHDTERHIVGRKPDMYCYKEPQEAEGEELEVEGPARKKAEKKK